MCLHQALDTQPAVSARGRKEDGLQQAEPTPPASGKPPRPGGKKQKQKKKQNANQPPRGGGAHERSLRTLLQRGVRAGGGRKGIGFGFTHGGGR